MAIIIIIIIIRMHFRYSAYLAEKAPPPSKCSFSLVDETNSSKMLC